MENRWLVSPSRQCSRTPVGFGEEFLSKKQCEKLEHSPYSPDPAAADFYYSFHLNQQCEVSALDIIKNVTEELKWLSQNGFQECYQHLYSRWQSCIVAQGDYTEGNVGQIVVRFCISQKISDSRNVLKLPRMTVRKSFNNASGDAVNPGSSSPRFTTPALTNPRF